MDKGEVDEVRDVVERYIGKSDPYIVMVSTPNAPNGLFDKIEREPEDTCLYKRVKLDYTYGLGKIYTNEEIEKAKHILHSNVSTNYSILDLKEISLSFTNRKSCRTWRRIYKDLPINPYCIHSIGVDPGFGKCNTAIVATEFLKEESKIRVIYAEQFEKWRSTDNWLI